MIGSKFVENIQQGFKRRIYWNKFISEITTQLKSKKLDYLIDPTFKNVNKSFGLSFKNYDTWNSQTPILEIKEINALIDSKPFYDQLVKNKQKA